MDIRSGWVGGPSRPARHAPTDNPAPTRVAFYGRRASVDTHELANRALAMQYLDCARALPAEARLVAVFYDLGHPGQPHPNPPDHLLAAGQRVTRDGGLAALFTSAGTPASCRFDHVIVADLSRFGRQARWLLTVLQRLCDLGVGVLLADRPGHTVRVDRTTIEHLAAVFHHRDVHQRQRGGDTASHPATGPEQDAR